MITSVLGLVLLCIPCQVMEGMSQQVLPVYSNVQDEWSESLSDRFFGAIGFTDLMSERSKRQREEKNWERANNRYIRNIIVLHPAQMRDVPANRSKRTHETQIWHRARDDWQSVKRERNVRIVTLMREGKFDEAAQWIAPDMITEVIVTSAAGKGCILVLMRMIECGLNNDDWILKGIVRAAEGGHVECIKFLLGNLKHYNSAAQGFCLKAVIRAVKGGKKAVVSLFIQTFNNEIPFMKRDFAQWGQSRIEWVGEEHTTPLHAAIENNDLNTVVYLLKNGASLGLRDVNGEREREHVKRLGFARIEEVLNIFGDELRRMRAENASHNLDRSVNPEGSESLTVSDNENATVSLFTLIDKLEKNEGVRSVIYDRLLACPALASPFVINALGDTILHRAAKQDDKLLFGRIIQVNSSMIDVRNNRGETPLEIALIMLCSFGQEEPLDNGEPVDFQ